MVLQNPIYFIVLLSVLIFVHELGHFLAAKALNVKVTRFSIGFGPRIFAITRGETEYQVAWIPLGGYVKMAGDMGEEGAPEDEARGFLAQAPWKRALIVGAGPVASLGFPLLLYFILFLGFPQAIDVTTHYPLRTSSRVMLLEPGMPAAEAGVRVGDVITSVADRPVRTFDELRRAMEGKAGKQVALGLERDGHSLQLKLVPAQSEDGSAKKKSWGLLGVSPVPRMPLVGVPAGSAAERAGLRTHDRIVSVDGEPVQDMVSLEQRLDADPRAVLAIEALRRVPANLPAVDAFVPERVTAGVPRQPGQGLGVLGVELPDLYVGRVLPGSAAEAAGLSAGDRLVSLDGQTVQSILRVQGKLESLGATPFRLVWLHQGQERSAQIQQKPVDPKEPAAKGFDLGIRLPFDPSSDERVAFDVARLGPGAALVAAARKLGDTIASVGGNLVMLITGRVPFSMLGGPIMLYGIASQSAQLGLGVFLSTMALISVNLGLLNLLPIPVLDGFGLLSAFWEWVRRRPIPMRAREIANIFGLAVLVLLMLAVFKNDIARLLM